MGLDYILALFIIIIDNNALMFFQQVLISRRTPLRDSRYIHLIYKKRRKPPESGFH